MDPSNDERPRPNTKPPTPELPPAWTQPTGAWPPADAPRASKSAMHTVLKVVLWIVGGLVLAIALLFGTCFLLLSQQH